MLKVASIAKWDFFFSSFFSGCDLMLTKRTRSTSLPSLFLSLSLLSLCPSSIYFVHYFHTSSTTVLYAIHKETHLLFFVAKKALFSAKERGWWGAQYSTYTQHRHCLMHTCSKGLLTCHCVVNSSKYWIKVGIVLYLYWFHAKSKSVDELI